MSQNSSTEKRDTPRRKRKAPQRFSEEEHHYQTSSTRSTNNVTSSSKKAKTIDFSGGSSSSSDDPLLLHEHKITNDEGNGESVVSIDSSAAASSSSSSSASSASTTNNEQTRLSGKEYQKAVIRMLYKNSTLSRIDLQKLFNAQTFQVLTDDEKRRLSQYLPSVDVGEDGIAIPYLFKSQFFRESLAQFQSLIGEGWLNPNKDIKQIMEDNHESNTKTGTEQPNMQFWTNVVHQMDMSWVKQLE